MSHFHVSESDISITIVITAIITIISTLKYARALQKYNYFHVSDRDSVRKRYYNYYY